MVTAASEAVRPTAPTAELEPAECLALLSRGADAHATVTTVPEAVPLGPVAYEARRGVVTLRLSNYGGQPLSRVSLHIEGTDHDGTTWSLEAAGTGRDVTDSFQILAEQIGHLGPAAVAPEPRRFVEIRVTELHGLRHPEPHARTEGSPTRPGLGTVAPCESVP